MHKLLSLSSNYINQHSGQSQTMTKFSPYIYAWSKNDSLHFKANCLDDVTNKIGLTSVTLAFLVGDRYDEINSWTEDIKKFHGDVTLSIGGANGQFPSPTIPLSQQRAALSGFIKEANIKSIDLDIEGSTCNDVKKSTAFISLVHDSIQGCGGDIRISITLPVDFRFGLTAQGLGVIKLAQNIGLKVSIVNLMVMDYYTPLPRGSSWGIENIRVIQTVHSQLKGLFPTKSSHQLWAMIGICPMIGYNDDQSVFTLDDWEIVLKFAKEHQVGLLSFWALNRDQVTPPAEQGKKNVYAYSNSQDYDFAYCKMYKKIFNC